MNHCNNGHQTKRISESAVLVLIGKRSEGSGLNTESRYSKVRNTNILMALTGALLVYIGLVSYYLSTIISGTLLVINGTVLIFLGVLTICISLTEWQRRPWATRVATSIGGASCVMLLIFGFLPEAVLIAALYWDAIHRIKSTDETGTPVE